MGTIGWIHEKKVKLNHLLTPHTRIKPKWIKDVNVRLETIKILEESIGSKISDIACSNILSNISPQANKRQSKQMGLHQTNKKTAHRTREHIHQYI